MRHIEFIGIPGSGKSTVCDRVLTLLRENRCDAYHAREMNSVCLLNKLGVPYSNKSIFSTKIIRRVLNSLGRRLNLGPFYSQSFIFNNLNLTNVILSRISSNSNQNYQEYLCAKWMFQTISRYEIAKSTLESEEIILFDEGLAHRSNLLFEFDQELRYNEIYEYVSQIPVPDDLIILKVPIRIAYERMIDRDCGFPKLYVNQDRSSRYQFLKRNDRVIELVSEILGDRGSQVHRVNNTGEVSAVCHKLHKNLG